VICFSTLVNLFLYDIQLPRAGKSQSPSRADFVAQVFPQLEELQATVLTEVAAGISGAINTATTISTAAGTSRDDTSAVGNSTTADISTARDPTAAGISAGIATAEISAAGISGTVVGGSGGGKSVGVSELVGEGSVAAEDEEAEMVNMEQLKLSDGDDDDVMGVGPTGSYDDQHKKALINLSKTCQSLTSLIAFQCRVL